MRLPEPASWKPELTFIIDTVPQCVHSVTSFLAQIADGPTADILRRRLCMSDSNSILLIDSSARDRRHYSHILKAVSPHSRFFEAGNGADGLKLYRSQSIDCVILELVLPDVHGTDLLKQLANPARVPRVPLIVLTRLSYPTIGKFTKQNGATATFVKKLTSDKVLQEAVLAALSLGAARSSPGKGC